MRIWGIESNGRKIAVAGETLARFEAWALSNKLETVSDEFRFTDFDLMSFRPAYFSDDVIVVSVAQALEKAEAMKPVDTVVDRRTIGELVKNEEMFFNLTNDRVLATQDKDANIMSFETVASVRATFEAGTNNQNNQISVAVADHGPSETADFFFKQNDEFTENPTLGGPMVPVIQIAINPRGPSQGNVQLLSAAQHLEPLEFVMISPDTWYYGLDRTDRMYVEKLESFLESHGFVFKADLIEKFDVRGKVMDERPAAIVVDRKKESTDIFSVSPEMAVEFREFMHDNAGDIEIVRQNWKVGQVPMVPLPAGHDIAMEGCFNLKIVTEMRTVDGNGVAAVDCMLYGESTRIAVKRPNGWTIYLYKIEKAL